MHLRPSRYTKQPSSATSTTWVLPRYSRTKRLPGLKAGRRMSRRPARVRRRLSLLVKPLWCFDCSSKANIWTSKLQLICLGGSLPIKDRHCSRSSSRPAVSNPAISSPIPLLPMASLTEQSPRSFGHTTHRLTAKQKSSPNRGSIRG